LFHCNHGKSDPTGAAAADWTYHSNNIATIRVVIGLSQGVI